MMFDKIIYSVFAAAAIGGLVACTSSNETEELQSAQVQFRASEISRSSLTTIETIKESPFAVYGDMVSTSNAAATPTVVFNGTEVKYTDGAWSYSDPQYWFPGQTYSFVAIHPATPANIDGTPNYENNKLSFQYTYPESYGNAQDILVAAHRRKYTPGNPHSVAFEFKHIFARINFVAKVDPTSQSSIVIESLALVNISKQATYSVKPAATTNETSDFTGGWSGHAPSDATLFEWTGSVEIQRGGSYEFFPVTGENTDPLLIIPQDADPELKVLIKYHSTGSDSSTKESISNLFSTTVIAHGGRWIDSQSYTYNFTLGDNDVIIFNAPSIHDWEEAEGANYVVID